MVGKTIFNLVDIDFATEQFFQRSHTVVGDSTRHDQIKIRKIGVNIKRKAMRSHPSGYSDTYRSQLFFAYPDSGKSRNASRLYTVVFRDANHNFFDVANIAMDIATIRF